MFHCFVQSNNWKILITDYSYYITYYIHQREPLMYALGSQENLCPQSRYKKGRRALAGVAQWIECRLQTKGLPVRFPVRAHAWVAGQVLSTGHTRGNHTLIFLSLSFSFSSSLSKNE